MSRGRRALLLAGMSLLLGGVAASQVAGREAEIERRIGSPVPVVVAARAIGPGQTISARDLAVREVPGRYVPRGSFASPGELVGARAAAAIPAGGDVPQGLVEREAPAGGSRPGLRVVRIVAVGSAPEMPPGSLVDILITTETPSGGAKTTMGLRRAEVVDSRAAPGSPDGTSAGLPRAQLALRVTVPQALMLAEAQSGAREIRALAGADAG